MIHPKFGNTCTTIHVVKSKKNQHFVDFELANLFSTSENSSSNKKSGASKYSMVPVNDIRHVCDCGGIQH